MQKETLILRRIAELLRDQQSAIAHGAATADFDRDACGQHRAKDRDLTSEILGWACLRRDFETSADFLRSALIAEVRRASGDVDCIIEQNDLVLCPQMCIKYPVVEYNNVDGPIRAADVII